MDGADEGPREKSWIEWTSLAFAAGAYVCATLLWLRPRALFFAAALTLAFVGLVAYLGLRFSAHHSWRNTFALVLLMTFLLGIERLLPRIGGPPDPARRAQCLSYLKQLGLACHMYSQDNDEFFPPNMGVLHEKYATDSRLFVCTEVQEYFEPYEGPPTGVVPDEHQAYCYVARLKPTDPVDYILAFDEEWNHDGEGVNVLHVDGHVKWTADINGLHEKLRRQIEELETKGREGGIIRPSWSRYPERPVYPKPAKSGTSARTFVFVAAFVVLAAGVGTLVVRARRRPRRGATKG